MFVPHAKIAVPELPSEFVDRAALRAYLDAADAWDVTLVCAPAGFGKSSLLADWARTSTDVDAAWVILDAHDNDPQRLWTAVVAAIASCPSVPPSSRLREPWAWNPADQPTFVAELLDALRIVPTPIRLILDDVHELISAEALGGLESFIRHRPIGVQLVLSSRLDPPVSLPRLRLAGRLGQLRVDRLRFSRSETAAMLRSSGLRLTPEQVQVLHEKTGGWAAGLRLAAFAVANTPDLAGLLADFSDDEHPVADYLVEKILAELPDDTQEFLRVTSISDPIPTRLAIELSGREDAGNLLDKLEDETSLVMATGPLREGYRVQPLLRIYLLADLQRHGATQAAGLRATAARWWAAQGGRYGTVPSRGWANPLITAVHGPQAAS
jgi:LuxR family maltose regulon positive regulatory protein